MEEKEIKYSEIKQALVRVVSRYKENLSDFHYIFEKIENSNDILLQIQAQFTQFSIKLNGIFQKTSFSHLISDLVEFLPDFDQFLGKITTLEEFKDSIFTTHLNMQQNEYAEDLQLFKDFEQTNLNYTKEYLKEDRSLFYILTSEFLNKNTSLQINQFFEILRKNPFFFINAKECAENCTNSQSLLQQSENLKQRSDQLFKDIKKEHTTIKKLRKEAIQLGLAQRYTQEKKSNNYSKWFWTILVGLGLCGLFFLSDLSNTISQNLNENTQRQIQNPSQSLSDYALNFLKKSPAYLALVWFILFASRRRNEANRLASDYAHKEVFASSYEAYQEEIKKLKKTYPQKADELTELNTKLLDSMIGVLSDNPAKSLDTKKTIDELPTKELVKFASEIIKLK